MKPMKKKKSMMLISDIKQYSEYLREFAAEQLSENHSEDLDTYISLKQVENLVLSMSKTKNSKHYVSEKKHRLIIETIMDMIYGFGLAKLAGSDKIECAWDEEHNSMVFWSKTQYE
jgi:hypothetical protein